MAHRRTLWEMLDGLRYARALLLAYFLVSWTILLTLPSLASILAGRSAILLLMHETDYTRFFLSGDSLRGLLVWSAAAAAAAGVLFIVWATHGREWRCLARLGAKRAKPGECEATRGALHEIALAAGLHPCPALYLIPDDESVNAVVLGRSARSAAVAVTTGLAYRCPKDLQRAVFAGLLSRFRNGGVGWTTLRYMLMEPISRATRRYTVMALLVVPIFVHLASIGLVVAVGRHEFFSLSALVGGMSLILAIAGTAGAVLVMGWVIDRSFRRNHATLVLSADAEGVLLLREPTMMLSALKSLLSVNSRIAEADGLSYLAIVDPSRASTLDRPTPLDLRRLQRLEELAFPSPPGSTAAFSIAPLESSANHCGGVATNAV